MLVITHMAPSNFNPAERQPITVEPPRRRDAMTVPLRNAFHQNVPMPDDWMAALAAIDEKTRKSAD